MFAQAPMQCAAPGGPFVQLSSDRKHFQVQQSPFFFAGCNCYYLMTRAAEAGLRHQVLEVLDGAVASGVSVVRTWAFNDGSEWNALQTAPGESTEVFFGLVQHLRNALRTAPQANGRNFSTTSAPLCKPAQTSALVYCNPVPAVSYLGKV